MNCEQFENRAQQLLDKRVNLRLDLPLQQHARACAACQHALAIYDCFDAMAGDSATAQPVSLDANSPIGTAWRHRQHRQLRQRIMVAAAALLMISLTLVTRTVTAPSTAWFVSTSPEMNLASVTNSVDFSGLWAFQEQLPQVPEVDLTAISRIDLMALMPHKPALVVRNLPATIETIEPIYRYSTEFPILNQWSTGINYTLGLIQSTLPDNQQAGDEQPPHEFGQAPGSDRRHLC